MKQKFKLQLLIISIFTMLLSCSVCEEKVENRNLSLPLTYSDSIWVEFSKSMEVKNVKYLLENSLDTVKCTDCVVDV